MEINFDEVDDLPDFSPLPEGVYPCEVISCEAGISRKNHPKWSLQLAVIEGHPNEGRTIFDNLMMGGGGIKRTKVCLPAFGISVEGKVEINTSMLVGKRVNVEVGIEDWEKTTEDGEQKSVKVNKVTFRGYSPLDAVAGDLVGSAQPVDETPF